MRQAMWSLLWSSLRGNGAQWRRLAAWSAVQALPAFLSGRLVAEALDHGFLAGRTTTGFAWLAALAATVLVGAWAMRHAYGCLAAIVEPFRDTLVSLAVEGSLRRSTVAGAHADTAGVARLTQQVEIAREAYAAVLNGVQGFAVVSVGALLGLSTLMPALLLLVIPPVAIGLALFLAALGRLAARQRAAILADERIAESSSALAGGLRDIMACGAEREAHAAVGRHIDAQARAVRDLARFTSIRILVVVIGGWLPLILIVAAGPSLTARGATPGVILGALTYVVQGVQPALLTLVRQLGGPGLWLLVTLRRLLEVAGVPETAPEPAGVSGPQWPLPPRHGVRLSGVTFAYGPFAEPVIRELDLVIGEDDHLAVVGPSGVGKSTLAGLIAGVLEPQAGEVRIGGVPLRRLGRGTITRHRVLIPQEAYVFTGSVGENVTYFADATPAAIEHAVRELGMEPLVERLGGYHADVDPSLLSAGERQLLTLARAYVSPARLVVLDEATCHLDAAAEAQVEQAFARREGALVVIAHRMSSALRADRILVLDGTDVLLGTHDELLAESALYRDLVGHWQAVAVDVGATA